MSIPKTVLAFAAAIVFSGPVFAAPPSAAGKPVVVVSILPQEYFLRRVGGDRVRSTVLVGSGQSPHSYEPTPRQIADLGRASAWLSIGVEFETALMPKVRSLYPKLLIVDTTQGVRMRTLENHHHGEGEGHQEEEHDEAGGRDPHIWLGRDGARRQAMAVRDVLSRIDPEGASVYAHNCDALLKDIDDVFDSLKKDLAPLAGKPVFVYHPSFGYFLDEFGAEQIAVEEGGKEPTQKDLVALISEAREHGARVVFVQPQFSRSAAKTVADAIGGVVLEINALDADWLENLKRMGEALRSSLR